MLTKNLTKVFVLSIIGISLFSCKTEEVILHGDIKGLVDDAETSEPIQSAMLKLIPSNDTTFTGNDGTYLLKNITPGEYEIQASKFAYVSSPKKKVKVVEANTGGINFSLNPIAVPIYSDTILNFGLDLTTLSFTISNAGTVKLAYTFNTSHDWISINPSYGDVTNETDSISITVDRTDLSDSILYKGTIRVISDYGADTIYVAVNGLLYGGQFYKIVKIGTQTWMAENLNVGAKIDYRLNQTNNDTIEKYCYANNDDTCIDYGGLYQWNEMMQYNPSDNGTTGTTQGICPISWHIPTENEWLTLINYLGGSMIAGGKLKETDTVYWAPPNTGATNESGFTARPGGNLAHHGIQPILFAHLKERGLWVCSTEFSKNQIYFLLIYHDSPNAILTYETDIKSFGNSVRCIKDP
jgi:uncharacterized protein (TIGR02145 family)